MKNLPPTIQKINAPATLAILIALICWSTGPVFIHFFADYFDPWSQNFFRYLAAALFWLPLLLLTARKNQLHRKIWFLALLPALSNILMQTAWTLGLYYIMPGFANLLTKSSILWIAGFSLLFFPEERSLLHSRYFWTGLLLCLIGLVGVIVFQTGFHTSATLTGILITFGSGLGWAVYTIIARISFRHIDSRLGFSITSIYTTLGLGLLALLFGRPTQSLNLSPKIWLLVALSGFLNIAIAHSLFYVAIKRIGATLPSIVLLLSPFLVLTISHLTFGETLHLKQILAGILLLIGAALAVWAQQHLTPPPKITEIETDKPDKKSPYI